MISNRDPYIYSFLLQSSRQSDPAVISSGSLLEQKKKNSTLNFLHCYTTRLVMIPDNKNHWFFGDLFNNLIENEKLLFSYYTPRCTIYILLVLWKWSKIVKIKMISNLLILIIMNIYIYIFFLTSHDRSKKRWRCSDSSFYPILYL